MVVSLGAVERYTVFWLTSYLSGSWLHIYAMKSASHCDLQLESSLCSRLQCANNPIVSYKDFIGDREIKTQMRVSNKGLDIMQPRLAPSSMSGSVVISSFAAKLSRQSTMQVS